MRIQRPRFRNIVSSVAHNFWEEFCADIPAPVRIGLSLLAAVILLALLFAPLPGAQLLRSDLGVEKADGTSHSLIDAANVHKRLKARPVQSSASRAP
jgi:hypothetical protein